MKQEIPLIGGRTTPGVARVGDTVHRPITEHATYVHDLLKHLEGREILDEIRRRKLAVTAFAANARHRYCERVAADAQTVVRDTGTWRRACHELHSSTLWYWSHPDSCGRAVGEHTLARGSASAERHSESGRAGPPYARRNARPERRMGGRCGQN
jgi:hypothetical protein